MGYLLFSIICYALGMGAIAGAFWFMEFGFNTPDAPFTAAAAAWDFLLFMIFPVQHSLMARMKWKNWIHSRMHPLMERPLYVGTSGLLLGIVLCFWKPFGPVLWSTTYRFPFDLVFFLCVALIIWTSSAIGHSTLFGLKQGIAAWKGASLPDHGLAIKAPFQTVRHPLTTLLIIAAWSHHELTAGRLEWNLLITAYSLLGVVFEERDLVKKYGAEYLDYRRNVPAFIPSLRRTSGR